jgi:hypothetical protein
MIILFNKMSEEIKQKTCIICNKIKIFENYHKNASGTHGYHNECKSCRSEKRKKINITKPTKGTKECNKCKNIFDISNFYADKSNSTGLQTYCKNCGTQNTKKCTSTLDGFIKKLYKDILHNIKKRAKIIKCEITIQDIKDLYDKQKGLCALTGKKLSTDTYMVKENQHIINKFNISVDRIDSNKDYTKDNIQLVGAIINRIKSDLSNDQFIDLCNMVIKTKIQ